MPRVARGSLSFSERIAILESVLLVSTGARPRALGSGFKPLGGCATTSTDSSISYRGMIVPMPPSDWLGLRVAAASELGVHR